MTTTRRWLRNGIAVTGLACAAAAAVGWLVWEQSPERRAERLDAEIHAIEATMKADRAALIREQAECTGGGVEFGAAYAQACMRSVQLQADLIRASTTKADAALQGLRHQRETLTALH